VLHALCLNAAKVTDGFFANAFEGTASPAIGQTFLVTINA
jgi:hypothetical protein